MAWNDMGDGALAELDDALGGLNDAFGGLEGFDALAGSVKIVIPVVVGGGVAFGTAAALDYFIEDAETRESVMPYKWLIGAGVAILAGLAMYKFQGPTEGVVTMATGIVTSLAGWGMETLATGGTYEDQIAKLNAQKAAIQAAWLAANPSAGTTLPANMQGLGRYRMGGGPKAPGVLAGTGTFGRYTKAPFGSVVM